MKLPLPDTGLEARIQDLEIIATGDVDKIDARIQTLEQLKTQTQDSSEKAALESRIAVLKAAKTKADTDKNTAAEAKKATDEAKERFKDQDIIARGDKKEIEDRKKELQEQLKKLAENTPEYKALEARIKALENGAAANKKDKGSKKSADDLASWGGRVATASTNAFSASVNGVSVGFTGVAVSLGVFSYTCFGFAMTQVGGKTSDTGIFAKNKGVSTGLYVQKTIVNTNTVVTGVAKVATKLQRTQSCTNLIHNNLSNFNN